MAFYTYTFTHYATGAIATVLSNVTSWSTSGGRQNFLDPLTATTAQINGRIPSALPTINIGDLVTVQASPYHFGYSGFISDFQVNYGINSAEDRWTIMLEDSVAILGRSEVTVSWSAGETTGSAINAVCIASGVDYFGSITDSSRSRVSAQSFTNANALEIVRTLIATEQGTFVPLAYAYPGLGAMGPAYNFLGRSLVQTSGGRFNDGTLTAITNSDLRYDSLDFSALSENYTQRVIVEPAGLAAQTAGTGSRTYTVATYDQTTTQALQLAQYIDAVLDSRTAGPERISILAERQITPTLPSAATTIILRNNSYSVQVLGGPVQADPESTRLTYNLSAGSTMNWLYLNNTTFGKLDQNRLGF